MDKEIRWRQRFSNLEKAILLLKDAVDRIDDLDDLSKEGLIQRFEYTFELSWKTLMDYLEAKGIQPKFPRDVIKEAYQAEIIEDGEVWLEMLEARNLIAHTYDETSFEMALNKIRNHYYEHILKLYQHLQNEK